MQTKILEIRDRHTFILVLCVDMNPSSGWPVPGGAEVLWALRRCGYPCDQCPNILLTRLDGEGVATNDPYNWPHNGPYGVGERTYPVAHDWIIKHWAELSDGDVVDVEFILGETKAAKISERFTS